jgi:hypothetical protein
MFKRVSNIITRALNHKKCDIVKVEIPPSCSADIEYLKLQHLETIERLQKYAALIECRFGLHLFNAYRPYFFSRALTIAKLHLKRAKDLSYEDWCLESRSLIRYINSTKSKYAAAVQEILMPFDIRYQEARAAKKVVAIKSNGGTSRVDMNQSNSLACGNT